MDIISKNIKKFQKKSQNVVSNPIEELISSEVDYLVILHNIVNGYLREYRDKENKITPPRNLRNNEGELVFANVEALFEWHRDCFLKSLVVNQHSPRKLADVFINNESKFQMYAVYGKNKTLSTYLVKKHSKYFEKLQKKLGFKQDLKQMLISPIRRLANYGILLESIIKYIKKVGLYDELPSMYEAENIMKSINTSVNDYMILEGIQDFIPNYGKLLHHGFLRCDYKKHKNYLLYIFLCKKFIVFTRRQDDEDPSEPPSYKIFLEIPMNKIDMYELPENKFFLCSNFGTNLEYNIFCSADDDETYQIWMKVLRRQLELQYNFMISLENPSENDDTSSTQSKPSEVLI